MLSLEGLRSRAAATVATFPLHALQMEGKTIGLLRDAALPTLPFAPAAYTDATVSSLDEAAPLLAATSTVQEVSVRWCARLTLSVAAGSLRHGILLRNVLTNASYRHVLSTNGNDDLGDLDAVLATVAADTNLWRAEPSSTGASPCCSVHVYLMSEPVVPRGISSTLIDLPAVPAPHVEGIITTRVVLGNTPEEVVVSLRNIFIAVLAGDGKVYTGTEVCWPAGLAFPVNVHTRSDARRRTEHGALLLPNRGLLHHRDALQGWSTWEDLRQLRPTAAVASFRTGESWERHLVTNPHAELPVSAAPALRAAETLLTSGCYDYYHYRVDGFRDDGWGCAYRSLQTVLSWFQHAGQMTAPVPSLHRIQEILYATDPDKASKKQFVGSCEWIGSFEVMLVLQHYMPGLDCTIRRMESGKDLETDPSVQLLLSEHFRHSHASPVMIGGSSYAHTILGMHVNVNTMEVRYLILDPHYSANPTHIKTAIKKGYVGWKEASSFFEAGSWYNLCIPRTDTYDPR